MTKLQSPYLHPDGPPTRKVEFQVSRDDLQALKARLPRHGLNDAFFGTLFHQVITQLKTILDPALDYASAESNEQRAHDILNQLILPRGN